MTRIYLLGDETPIWVTEPADLLIGRIEQALPNAMLAVTVIGWNPSDDEDDDYTESTGFIRADQVTFIAPLWRKVRDQINEKRAA